jgi:hypothetical protein
MESDGWFKVDRNIRRWQHWNEKPFDTAHAFLDLIARAAFNPHRVRFSDSTWDLKRGQLITSGRVLADAWGWSRTKVDRWLEIWQEEGSIRCPEKNHLGTLIEVRNYAFYQDGEKQRATKSATKSPRTSQRKATREEGKKVIKERKIPTDERSPGTERQCQHLLRGDDGKQFGQCQMRTSLMFCLWHDMNARGKFPGIEGPPRDSANREFFGKWFDTLEDTHKWRKLSVDELWVLIRGGQHARD